MDSSYKVKYIDNNRYDLVGVELVNGTSSCYWKNKGDNNINDVIVLMNNSDVNVNNKNIGYISNTQACISLEGINNVDDIRNIIGAFSSELSKMGVNINKVRFGFVVSNKEDEERVKEVVYELKINFYIIKSDKYRVEEDKKEEVVSDEKLALDKNIEASNGVKYTEVVGKSSLIANLSTLSNSEELRLLYDKYMNEHPDIRRAFNNGTISNDQIIEELQRQLIQEKNLKEYRLDSASSDIDKNDNVSKVSNMYANRVGGVVNEEIGIVKDGKGSYKTIDDRGNISNAKVTSSSYNGNATNTEVIKPSYGYHFDGGKSNSDVFGDSFAGEYSEDRDQKDERIYEMDKPKSKVRVLKKPERPSYEGGNKSAAFVSLPVIIFIISLVLLVGSGIILFLIK